LFILKIENNSKKFMVSSVPQGGGEPQQSSGFQMPPQVMAGIKVNPGDEKLLDTAWGKWMERMPGAPADKEQMIKLIKASIQQYCNMIRNEIQQDQERAKKAAEMLKRAAEGQDPNG
jgi:hypothetical protein